MVPQLRGPIGALLLSDLAARNRFPLIPIRNSPWTRLTLSPPALLTAGRGFSRYDCLPMHRWSTAQQPPNHPSDHAQTSLPPWPLIRPYKSPGERWPLCAGVSLPHEGRPVARKPMSSREMEKVAIRPTPQLEDAGVVDDAWSSPPESSSRQCELLGAETDALCEDCPEKRRACY